LLAGGSLSIFTPTLIIGGILSAVATAYISVSRRRVKSRSEESSSHVTNITNINIAENIFMHDIDKLADEVIDRFDLRGEKQK
jgi:hypothetical protein